MLSPITDQYICFNENIQIEVASLYLKSFYDSKFVFINILRQHFMFHKKLKVKPMQKYIPYLNNGKK